MITKKEFIEFMENYQKFVDRISEFDKSITGKSYPSILYETDWFESVNIMLETFLFSHFTDKGLDWIYYYLFENVSDKAAYITQDEDMFTKEREIRYPLDTLEELWIFLQSDVKLYFKDA